MRVPALKQKGRRNTISATSLPFDSFVIQFPKKIVKYFFTLFKSHSIINIGMKINFTETILKSFPFTDTKIERTVKATLYIKYEYDSDGRIISEIWYKVTGK